MFSVLGGTAFAFGSACKASVKAPVDALLLASSFGSLATVSKYNLSTLWSILAACDNTAPVSLTGDAESDVATSSKLPVVFSLSPVGESRDMIKLPPADDDTGSESVDTRFFLDLLLSPSGFERGSFGRAPVL